MPNRHTGADRVLCSVAFVGMWARSGVLAQYNDNIYRVCASKHASAAPEAAAALFVMS